MLAQLRERMGRFEAAGVRVACVIQARPDQVREICGPDLTCVPDPEFATHKALALSRMAVWKLFGVRDLLKRRKSAAAAGFKQDWKRTFAKESDSLLMPAAALVSPQGMILWLHRGRHVGDLPSADELLAHVQRVLATA